MKAAFRTLLICGAMLPSCLAAFGSMSRATIDETITFGRFGTVALYRSTPRPSQVVLFVSGDGGWNEGVVDMARTFASLDALVAGIDITYYLAALERAEERCSYPAGDFEELAKFVEKRLDYPRYVAPILVGYSSGATLIYAALVQAPAAAFLGGLSLGFCPDLPVGKPFCPGSGLTWGPGPGGHGVSFLPAPGLEIPWIVLQGAIDQVCEPHETEEFVRKSAGGHIVVLPKVGHGYSVPRNWLPQLKEAFRTLASRGQVDAAPPTEPSTGLDDLPLIELPASGSARNVLAVHLTGDGGWGVTDRGLAQALVADGIPVVGLNCLQYFWHARTPEEAAEDLNRILKHYLAAWGKQEIVLIGYSFGADVLPFLANRLPAEMQGKVRMIALLGPSAHADFQFHVTDWLGARERKDSLPVLPEIANLAAPKILCFFGEGDHDAICKDLDPARVTSIPMSGGHRIGGRFEELEKQIVEAIP